MLALLLAIGTQGCIGTKHVAIPNGSTGQVLRTGATVTAAFPDSKGELTLGQYQIQAGDLIRRPKTQAEVIEALKASGATFKE
jgi:ABC-type transporter Mla subunit MlaD